MNEVSREIFVVSVVVVVVDLVSVISRVTLFLVNHTRLKNNFMTRKK